MPYDKTRNNQSVQKAPYVRPPRTHKHIPCHCQECKGKSIDPRTKKKHDSRFTNRIIPQRGYTNLTETPNDNHSPINLIPSPEIIMNINNEEDHEENLQEESYQILVKRASIGVRKNNRMSTFTTPEVINELLSDDDNVSEDERRELEDSNVVDEDITSESDEDCQVDFSAPEIEMDRGESIRYEKESDDQYSWIVIWILNSKPAVAPKFTECTYQDFPDHPMSNKRNPCGATLYKNVYTKDGVIKKPALIFPTISLKHQLSILFKRKGFEESCRKWVNRPSDPEILADVYDDELTSHADQDLRLQESLEILKPRDSVGSLSIYDKYTDEDYKAFHLLSTTIEEGAAFGFEAFPGSFLGPSNENVPLPKNVLLLLTEFYCNTYGQNFTALSNIHNAPEGSIPVLPQTR
ncbi:unnamed protein product [Rhizophagus irregularis]|uniref:Uncharacterized protein n=1 Tax=Rhizophagus irregularis TaxID=588596 RepID=A0A915Z267_9GLOM|nr:unnamed protein product [Rhizophagus irregularis]